MPVPRRSLQGEWPGLFTFVFAMAGASIGLGSLWRFPALVEAHGGGVFLLAYAACVLLLALPLLLAEMVVGRAGRQNVVNSYGDLAQLHGQSDHWAWVGRLMLFSGLALLLVLMVFGGWAMGYVFRATTGALGQLDAIDAAALLRGLQGDVERSLLWVTVFAATAVAVVSQGLSRGLVPGMLVLAMLLFTGLVLLVLLGPGAESGQFAFLLQMDYSQLTREAWLAALRHAFYTLAVGTGVVVTLTAYLPDRVSVVQAGLLVLVADLIAALLGTAVVLSLLQQAGLPVVTGPTLVFQVLPVAIGGLGNSMLLGTLFYLVLAVVALSSGVAILEAATVAVVERHGVRRGQAAISIGLMMWFLALLLVLSQAMGWDVPGGASALDVVNLVAARLLLPLSALLAVLYAGWLLSSETVRFSLGYPAGWGFHLWYGLLRWCAPVLVLLVIAANLGLLD